MRRCLTGLVIIILTVFGFGCAGRSSNNANGPVQLNVLFPPTSPFSGLVTNPLVTGANFAIKWADVDRGPGANPQYDFTGTDAQFRQWIDAGKKIDLIIWPMTYSAPNDATPLYVLNNLAAVNQTLCGEDGVNQEITPNFFAAAFQLSYKAFILAVIQHYSSSATVNGIPGFSNPAAIGYIRIGFAQGGETFPALGFQGSDPVCAGAFTRWGWTPTAWTTYLKQMLDYETSLNFPMQLMVAINAEVYQGATQYSIADTEAAVAVADGIAFGNEGLTQTDIAEYNAQQPCEANWCAEFDLHAGRVPLELQLGGGAKSDPTCHPGPCLGNGTGSLVDLLPFAVQRHTTILEIGYPDWQIAFDSTSPDYAHYHAAYQQALQVAAQGGRN